MTKRLALIILFALVACTSAWATPEDICPGGSSPRGDITWCIDLETLGSCSTGQEGACVSANGLTSLNVINTDDFKIGTCPNGAAVGTGCVYGSGKPGGTGAGYSTKTFTGSDTNALRFYAKFENGFWQGPATFGANHMPGFIFNDGSTCSGIFAMDTTAGGVSMSVEVNTPSTSCGANVPVTFGLPNNIDNTFVPQNGHWYLFEERVIMNTTASSSTGIGGGNGTFELKIENVLRASYSNINMRGASTTAKVNSIYAAREYYGAGVPSWKPLVLYDNFAYSNTATWIGAATAENARGTADSLSPYTNYTAYQGFEGIKSESDCSTPSSYSVYPQTGMDFQWRTAPTYVTSPVVNGYANNCNANRRALKAQTTTSNDGSGIYGDLKLVNNRVVLHGRIYLPSTNSYASDTPLFGVSRYGSGSNFDYALQVGRNAAGNWMLWQKSNPTITKTDLGVAATTDTWHEFEFHAASTGKVSLYIDSVWILDEATPAVTFWSWLSDTASAGSRKWNIGIFDASPATTFACYYDDVDIGTASTFSSRGWGNSPFATPTPTPTPSPSLNLPSVLIR